MLLHHRFASYIVEQSFSCVYSTLRYSTVQYSRVTNFYEPNPRFQGYRDVTKQHNFIGNLGLLGTIMYSEKVFVLIKMDDFANEHLILYADVQHEFGQGWDEESIEGLFMSLVGH